MKIYNNNPAFGDCGPFEVDAPTFRLACHLLANEMRPNFEGWAQEQEDRHAADVMFNPDLPEFMPREKRIAEMRHEFLKGLTEVVDETREEEFARTQPPCGLDDAAEGNDAWIDAHTCPKCGTRAPECYDDEEHPSWDCSTCIAAPSC